MADETSIPIHVLIEGFLLADSKEKENKAEKEVSAYWAGERQAYFRLLKHFGHGEEFARFKEKWCTEEHINKANCTCEFYESPM